MANNQCRAGYCAVPGDNPALKNIDPNQGASCTFGSSGNFCKGLAIAREKTCATGGVFKCCGLGDDPNIPEKPEPCYVKGLDKVIRDATKMVCDPLAKDKDCVTECQKKCAAYTPLPKMYSWLEALSQSSVMCYCFDPKDLVKSFDKGGPPGSWEQTHSWVDMLARGKRVKSSKCQHTPYVWHDGTINSTRVLSRTFYCPCD